MDRGLRVVAIDLWRVVSVDRRVVSIHRSRVIVSILRLVRLICTPGVLRLVRLISTPDVLRLVRLVSAPVVGGASLVVSMMWWRTTGTDREEPKEK